MRMFLQDLSDQFDPRHVSSLRAYLEQRRNVSLFRFCLAGALLLVPRVPSSQLGAVPHAGVHTILLFQAYRAAQVLTLSCCLPSLGSASGHTTLLTHLAYTRNTGIVSLRSSFAPVLLSANYPSVLYQIKRQIVSPLNNVDRSVELTAEAYQLFRHARLARQLLTRL